MTYCVRSGCLNHYLPLNPLYEAAGDGPRLFNEIAYQLGYEDSSFVRKVFKRHASLLPGEYRRKFRGA